MFLAAVTGTNGKTTVADLTRQLMNFSGFCSASFGTLGLISDLRKEQNFPLIGKDSFQQFADELKCSGEASALIFEAYSSCLEYGYYNDLNINVAAFTNLSNDHVEYHKSFENYKRAKFKLFSEALPNNSSAVICHEDELSKKIIEICNNRNISFITYGFNENSHLRIVESKIIGKNSIIHLEYKNQQYELLLPFFGEVFLLNWLCAIGIGLQAGISIEHLLSVSGRLLLPPGRLEFIISHNGADIFIDYAHNPEALKKILLTLKKITKGHIHLLFGCGGDRDKKKREYMGKISNIYADHIYVTDDNPRTEIPQIIRFDILKNCTKGIEFKNRFDAISYAIDSIRTGDSLLIAGKGHEVYQLSGNDKQRSSDREIVLNHIKVTANATQL